MILLSLLGLGITLGTAVLPFLPAFVPRLGPRLYERLPLRQRLLAVLGLGLTLTAAWFEPASATVWLLWAGALVLAVHAELYPRRILVALTDPPHVSVDRADLGADAVVLGLAEDHATCAWTFEMLVPRHLVNDHVGNRPVLIAY